MDASLRLSVVIFFSRMKKHISSSDIISLLSYV